MGLSPLQERLALLVSGLSEAEGFALAGGAALILRGVVDRRTADLDFFGREAAAVNRLAESLDQAARQGGWMVKRLFDASGFVRMEISDARERCEVDLGVDARLWPAQDSPLGPVIADEESAADKTLALFGRAAARDFIDVHALALRHGEGRLLELAAAKDLGFSTTYLGHALAAIERLDRDQFDIDDSGYEELRAWALGWSRRLEAPSADRSRRKPVEGPEGPQVGR